MTDRRARGRRPRRRRVDSDLQFVGRAFRVPFQFSREVRAALASGAFVEEAAGVMVTDLDGNESYDVAGSYGVNVFGTDVYRACMDDAVRQVRALGLVLGSYHPLVADNARRLRAISGLVEVSFHSVRHRGGHAGGPAQGKYYTRCSHVVQFCGAYHGWRDGVQPGIGNPRVVHDVYTLRRHGRSHARGAAHAPRHRVRPRLGPLQALHPNRPAPGDGP
ncbi:MAG: hypothetical protein R2712_24885 [Vicinamibacterales bacterium]